MYNLFRRGYTLTSLDLSSFDTTKITDMGGMFETNGNLVTVYVSDSWQPKSGSGMFTGTEKIIGQNGITFDSNHTDETYAYVDNVPEDLNFIFSNSSRLC